MLKAALSAVILLAGLAGVPALAQAPTAQGTTGTRPSTSPSVTAPTATTRPTTPAVTTRPAAPAMTAPTPATTPAPRMAASGGKIDINAASEQELDALPGIGPVLAKQIVAGRPWDDLNDLVKKKALPQGVFERNKDRFALANINTSSAADLAKTLPGIGDVRSKAIVSGRPYAAPTDLVSKKVLTQGQFDKIKDLVAF